ncbi:MAG TPA: S24 family peptidase [Stenomitos sp.]
MPELFEERLKRLIDERFKSVSDFARAIGKSSKTVDAWLPGSQKKRISRPRHEQDLDAIAEALKVSKAYLLTGEDGLLEPREIAKPEDLNKVIHVNLINVTVGAGNGHYVQSEEVIEVLEISKFFLKAYGLSEPFKCSAVTVIGPSMEPLLRSGDIVLVDHTQVVPQDGIYVVRLEDTVFVKHVAKLLGGKVRVFSAAEGYPVHEVEIDSPSFAIIGRVVWGGRRF